jgi:hypothetical protein
MKGQEGTAARASAGRATTRAWRKKSAWRKNVCDFVPQ